MISLILYSTAGCHLCELAEDVLRQAEAEFSIRWQWQEIADSQELMDRYAVRIPVLVDEGSRLELGWPFDLPALQLWLTGLSAEQTRSY